MTEALPLFDILSLRLAVVVVEHSLRTYHSNRYDEGH